VEQFEHYQVEGNQHESENYQSETYQSESYQTENYSDQFEPDQYDNSDQLQPDQLEVETDQGQPVSYRYHESDQVYPIQDLIETSQIDTQINSCEEDAQDGTTPSHIDYELKQEEIHFDDDQYQSVEIAEDEGFANVSNHNPPKSKHYRANSSHWEEEEKDAFLTYLAVYGKSWSELATRILTKTPNQIKNYYTNYRLKLGLDELLPEAQWPPNRNKPVKKKRGRPRKTKVEPPPPKKKNKTYDRFEEDPEDTRKTKRRRTNKRDTVHHHFQPDPSNSEEYIHQSLKNENKIEDSQVLSPLPHVDPVPVISHRFSSVNLQSKETFSDRIDPPTEEKLEEVHLLSRQISTLSTWKGLENGTDLQSLTHPQPQKSKKKFKEKKIHN